jgi:hypothetical protein
MAYRWVATSAAGFVQQLAVSYISNGYWFYVAGRIPGGKDPARTDAKLIAQYGLEVSKWTRARQRKQGRASVQYLRYDRFFVLVATHGEHPFFAAEGKRIRDLRRQPLHFHGYAIGCRKGRDGKWHASVRIAREPFADLKQRFAALAVHRSVEELCQEFRRLAFEPYAPVRDQLRILLRAVNWRRHAACLEELPLASITRRRRPVRPFGCTRSSATASPDNSGSTCPVPGCEPSPQLGSGSDGVRRPVEEWKPCRGGVAK